MFIWKLLQLNGNAAIFRTYTHSPPAVAELPCKVLVCSFATSTAGPENSDVICPFVEFDWKWCHAHVNREPISESTGYLVTIQPLGSSLNVSELPV